MIIVLVHGWSVSHTETYGELAARLNADSSAGRLPPAGVAEIHLSRYVSFSDEVRLEDLSRAFEAAVSRELGADIRRGERLAVITHSTGGPVVRDWWQRYYRETGRACPMDHLIMLAPANFGSALAQLGKTRIADLKSSLLDGVDPGVGVLDWLELGSPESWRLNEAWIRSATDPAYEPDPLFQFVLTGQSIDRKLYDHVNAYTGEPGSDGVVRVPSANLNASYLKLAQQPATRTTTPESVLRLVEAEHVEAPRSAFALIRGASHSGPDQGILRSIRAGGSQPAYRAIVRCLRVRTADDYRNLCDAFAGETQALRSRERLETRGRLVKRHYLHDAHAMLIVRLQDTAGHLPGRFDFKLTGPRNNPDALAEGTIVDRQRNQRAPGTLTFFLNADAVHGAPAVRDAGGRLVRNTLPGMSALGIEVFPRPRDSYVGHAIARLGATSRRLRRLVQPDQTVLLDLMLARIVRRGVFELTEDPSPRSFKRQRPGTPV